MPNLSSKKRLLLVLVSSMCIASASAMAQTGFGLRAGVSGDPNQFHFGVHFSSDPLISDLIFRPNLEIGVGSKVTTIATNFEFAYRIPIRKSDVSLYVGAGPALNVFLLHSDNSYTGGGFNVLFGLEHKDGLFGELKLGALDSPDVKFTVGFTFP
jgi:hypothetical protein